MTGLSLRGGSQSDPEIEWVWLGRQRFAPTAELQERLRGEVAAGARAETLLLCEHDPVITLGRGARAEHVLTSTADLAARGIEVHQASRGGDVTFHGPGQLVGYPVFRLQRGVLAHLESMAEALGAVLGRHGVTAEWRRSCPGLWVGADKICAFGVHVRRGVSIHGFALNVENDLGAFAHIVPCGLRASGVTSVGRLGGRTLSLPALAAEVAAAFAGPFRRRLREIPAAALAAVPDCKSENQLCRMPGT